MIRTPLVSQYQSKVEVAKSQYVFSQKSSRQLIVTDRIQVIQRTSNICYIRTGFIEQNYLVIERNAIINQPMEMLKIHPTKISIEVIDDHFHITTFGTNRVFIISISQSTELKALVVANFGICPSPTKKRIISAAEIEAIVETGDLLLFKSTHIAAKMQRIFTGSDYGIFVSRPHWHIHSEYKWKSILYRRYRESRCVRNKMGYHKKVQLNCLLQPNSV